MTQYFDDPYELEESRLFARQDRHSLDVLEDIFGEKDGIVFLIRNLETKLWLAEFPVPSDHTDDPKKAMHFKIRTQATAYCIENDILFSHEVVPYSFELPSIEDGTRF